MKISNDEIKKAFKIKNAVQNYLEMTKEVNIRSTDVFPYLVRKGIFVQDKNNGLFFRRFLKKLYKANMLKSLIPQCSYVPGINGEIFGEWYFNFHRTVPMSKEEECSNSRNDEPTIITIDEAKKTLYELIEGKNPNTGNLLDREEDPILFKISQCLKIFTEYEEDFAEANSNQNDTENHLDIVSTSSPPKKPVGKVRSTYSIDEVRKTYPNAYKPWEREEENLLIEMYKQGFAKKEIARKLNRQNGAIIARLRKLELIE